MEIQAVIFRNIVINQEITRNNPWKTVDVCTNVDDSLVCIAEMFCCDPSLGQTA